MHEFPPLRTTIMKTFKFNERPLQSMWVEWSCENLHTMLTKIFLTHHRSALWSAFSTADIAPENEDKQCIFDKHSWSDMLHTHGVSSKGGGWSKRWGDILALKKKKSSTLHPKSFCSCCQLCSHSLLHLYTIILQGIWFYEYLTNLNCNCILVWRCYFQISKWSQPFDFCRCAFLSV